MKMQTEKTENTIEKLCFGRYVPKKLLGKGAMGKVYLSEDPVLQRLVAVKVIALDGDLNEETRCSFLERFTLEARASAKLRHPSIVTVFDAGEQEGFPWIAFEYIDGESLEDLINKNKKLNRNQIYSILRDIASALQHAHEAGIVHRDVKPANILIEKRTGISKLTDFGVIKTPVSMATQEGMTLGSPGYMSPEQIDGSGVDSRSDLFSLGIIFYQLLTGTHPFLRDTLQATLYATLMGEYTPAGKINPDIDNKTEDLIKKLLKVNKNDRISSASEFLNELKILFDGGNAITAKRNFSSLPVKNKSFLNYINLFVQIVLKIPSQIAAFLKSNNFRSWYFETQEMLRKRFLSISYFLKKAFNDKTYRLSALYSVIFGVVLFLLIFLYSEFFSLSPEEKGVLKGLAEQGYTGSPAQLVKKCKQFIDKDELTDASEIATGLSQIRKESAEAYLLLAEIELINRDERDIIDAFDHAKHARAFKSAYAKEKSRILTELKKFLTDDEISRDMIDCVTYTLNLGNDRVLKKWVNEKPYWLRWNTIHILNEVGVKVDMVDVYILDLKNANSMRVRIRAANKLGDIGDKRAIPVLQEIAQRGFADPIVSAAAEGVLEDDFKKR